ncbi:hypothetical protein ACUNWD_02620 [Sunxiuqinia sp. A32]|uniref:hypothetical protein n=1 Tax=Sunxiuqinia sp. A32 TaxID=3461496 RepID=UPI004045B04F
MALRRIDETSLQEINQYAGELDQTIDQQKEAISIRELKAFERITNANELYKIMSEICEVGKRIWDGNNQAYYDDYLIYGSQTPLLEENEEVPEEENPGAVAP